MNNFVIDTPDNFWQIRWLDKYMEGHKGFIAGGCFKNILSGERVKDIDIFFESESDFQEAIDSFNDEKHQKDGGDNQIENWIRCMVNDELKQRDHDFVRRACENVIRNHVLNELNIIVRSKSEKCTCENRVPSEEDKKESTDGLYIIYKDGHAEPFTGHNSKDCVRYIGLKHRYMSFAISLTEHDIVQLLDDDSREESGSGTYYERECDALFDIDGRGNTERLVTRNPKLRNLLEDGEYIPSLGQLNLMAHYMNELNKAFAYVSASPLSSTWYWSSTESSQAVAWYVVFSSGLTGTGNKHIGDMVRAVIDF